MDFKDEIAINHLKSLKLKDSFQHDLTIIIERETDGFTRNIYFPQLTDIVVKYALEMCKEFKEKAEYISPAIRDYLIDEVCNAIEERLPDFQKIKNDVKNRVKLLF